MPSSLASSDPVQIERARPLLGTIASIRAAALSRPQAIEDAFAAIVEVQTVMSAFEPGSDLSRLHGIPHGRPVSLHPLTAQVVAFGLELAERSGGLFDLALGGESAARGALPQPVRAFHTLAGVQGASWHDIDFDGGDIVLKRPLWLDLSGIAKGFAVDRAVETLKAAGVVQGTVNIGGDLAVFGPQRETVHLRAEAATVVPELEISDAAVASSGGAPDRVATRHVRGRDRVIVDPQRFAAVIARGCMTADALTKVVLTAEEIDLNLLAQYGAQALCCGADGEWRIFGDIDG